MSDTFTIWLQPCHMHCPLLGPFQCWAAALMPRIPCRAEAPTPVAQMQQGLQQMLTAGAMSSGSGAPNFFQMMMQQLGFQPAPAAGPLLTFLNGSRRATGCEGTSPPASDLQLAPLGSSPREPSTPMTPAAGSAPGLGAQTPRIAAHVGVGAPAHPLGGHPRGVGRSRALRPGRRVTALEGLGRGRAVA